MHKRSFQTLIGLAGLALFFAMQASCAGPSGAIRPRSMIAGAEYVGTETCNFCHEKRVKDFRYTAHGRLYGDSKGQGVSCENCHGAGSLHVEAGGGRETHIINPDQNLEVCFQCHLAKKARIHLQYHHPLQPGRILCTNCHNPHGENIYSPKNIRITRINEICRQCHREKARPHVFEHEALREGCPACHNPHGSINDKMLVERDANLCLKCHAQLASPGTVFIGDFSHTERLREGPCWSAGCHTAIHGSDVNAHLRY